MTTTLISFCHWKTLIPFCLRKKTWKRIFNTNSKLSQNRTEKQIISSKTTINWLLNDIWCYLFIAFFDWKIVFFQQTVLRVYYILKYISFLGVLNWFAVHSQTKKYMEIIFRPRVGKVKHSRVFLVYLKG